MNSFLTSIRENQGLLHLLSLVFFARFIAASGVRIIYPLAFFLQEDWDLSRGDFGTILAISELAAIPAVFFGSLADKLNIKILTAVAYLLMSCSFAIISVDVTTIELNVFMLALISRIMFIFGYQIFFTTALSVVLGSVSKKLALTLGCFMEVAWALAALVSVPFVAYLYNSTSYQIVFISFTVIMGIISIDIIYKFPNSHLKEENIEKVSIKEIFKGLNHISVYTYNVNVLFVMCAHNGVFTVFTFWASDEFNVSVSQIGVSFFLIGTAELVGALLITYMAAKMNTKNLYYATYFFTTLCIFAIFGLLFVDKLVSALILLFIFFLSAEFVLVFTTPETAYYVEDKFNNSVISFHAVFMFIGRSIGAFIGAWLYSEYGLTPALLIFIISLILSIIFLRIGEMWKRTFEIEHNKNNNKIKQDEYIEEVELVEANKEGEIILS